jgi:1-pyrroline-5-carboxylate dehydrogenase
VSQAAKRSLDGLTIGPVLTWTTERILAHIKRCMALPGAELAFGGKALEGHTIPACYGAVEPTAVYLPIDTILGSEEAFEAATTELFGPFQATCRST